jgi:lipopolysaccharide cholinephosphotransferase
MEEHKLSRLQQAEFDIFKEFIKICNKEELRWFICGGSFLGAVRHKGFIPWDDDIDVAMPRPDFEKFIKLAPGFLPNDLHLSTYDTREDHITLVAQIIGNNKNFTLNNAEKQVQTGAWMDILVIDGAPKKGLGRKIFGIRYMYYRMMSQFAHFSEIVNLNKKRPWYEMLAIKFAQITNIEKHLDAVKIGDRFHRFLKSNPYETSSEVATFMGAAKMNEILPKEVYGVGTDYEFEGITVKGPDLYDAYLSHFYGDYMTPPPENERNRHNVCEGG